MRITVKQLKAFEDLIAGVEIHEALHGHVVAYLAEARIALNEVKNTKHKTRKKES